MHVVELRAVDTHPLRRSVLRDGTASDTVEFDGDELPSTVHLGLVDGGRVVAISTWIGRPWECEPDTPAHQLRGMATEPARRREGLGTDLLDAGMRRCRAAGSRLVWARARVTAIDFYVQHGFRVVGDEFVDATTGLPHRTIVRELR